MEIPYVVTPRKDNGLFNSKIAIWLFLASEVMLFGGFFSAYIFLRLGADFPWPERTLPVLPGLINTFILIGSSVTVLFAWLALTMRQWRKFQVYMTITILCSAIFMVLKALEYNVKFHHQAVRLPDYSVLEGHLAYKKESDQYVLNHKGNKIEENQINIKANQLTFSSVRFHEAWVKDIIAQATANKSTITLNSDVEAVVEGKTQKKEVLAKAGEVLSVELLEKIKKAHLAARQYNAKLRTESLKQAWKQAKAANPGVADWRLSGKVGVDEAAVKQQSMTELGSVSFVIQPAAGLSFRPQDIKEAPGLSRLRDDTVITGDLLDSPMVFHHLDAIDFRHLVMNAEKKGINPMQAIENSWLIKNSPVVRDMWEWKKSKNEELRKELAAKGDKLDKQGNKVPRYEPTHTDLYRIGWKQFAEKAEQAGAVKLSSADKYKEEFMGPNYKARGEVTFPELSLPRDQVHFASKFTPAWNNYYAIYFTMTGLHGLHVIGGAVVFLYYLLFGRAMFLSNPEWLANRVEVAGLFWHFVDLIWIFVFPIFYLM